MAERSVNKAILVGRLGSDAETRYTSSGTPVSRVSLAMNRQWTDSDDKVHEDTDWLTIVIWKKENLATYLTKGTRLYVEGRLQSRSYDDKDGVKGTSLRSLLRTSSCSAGTATEQAEEGKPNTIGDLASPQIGSEVMNRNLKIRASKKSW